MTRSAKITLNLTLFCAVLFGFGPVMAQARAYNDPTVIPVIDTSTTAVTAALAQSGFQVTLQQKEIQLSIPANSASEGSMVTAEALDGYPGTSRENEMHVGPIFRLTASQPLAKSVTYTLKVNRGGKLLRVWLRKYNEKTKLWDRVVNTIDVSHTWLSASIKDSGIYAAFESQVIQEGGASWYRSKKTLVAANNDFPIGSKILVRNVSNNKAVIVKVVSTGPFVTGRAIDLSYDAFKAIKGTNAGLFTASIQLVSSGSAQKVLGTTTSTPSVASQEQVGNKNTANVKARSYVVFDVDKGVILSAKNGDKAYPLASMTKLMTALVFLDQNVDWDKVITYESEDNADGAKLYIPYGEKIKVKDLWYVMLVGSANNAAKMIRKSTGLSVAAFRDKMNAKAKQLGLSSMYFYEPTGLDEKNVGSASDYARLAQVAFSKPDIQKASTKKTYSFKTAGTQSSHSISNLNKMLGSGWQVIGTKTGFTDEAMNNLSVEVIGKTSQRKILGVVMGSPTSGARYTDMDTVLFAGFALQK